VDVFPKFRTGLRWCSPGKKFGGLGGHADLAGWDHCLPHLKIEMWGTRDGCLNAM